MGHEGQLPANFSADQFLASIDKNVELHGLRVVFFDGQHMHMLREGPPWCGPDLMTVVIKPDLGQATLSSAEAAQTRDGRFYGELLGGVLSCGAATIGWVVIAGSSAAAPVTGGGSTFIAALAWGGTLASSAQCGNSVYRLYNEAVKPSDNDWLDSQHWYTSTSKALDLISLLGAATAVSATVRLALLARRTTGKTMTEVLKGLSRHERKRLTEEIIRMENPGISNKLLKQMVRAGTYPVRFTEMQISNAVRLQLKDALGAAFSFSGSVSSGVARDFVVGLAKSFETH